MSAFASTASASTAPILPTIEHVHGPGSTKRYELTLYKLSDVPDAHYSGDDKNFYKNFNDNNNTFKGYLHDTIDSREDNELSTAKKILCNEWVNNVTINKNNTTTSRILRGIIGTDICGPSMDSEFLTNRYADLNNTPNVGVLVMLVTINITTSAGVMVFPVFCLSFSTVRIQNNPVLVINGVCTQKRYSDGCPLYAFLFYKAVEHCITILTGINVITILSALAEAVAYYLKAGFGPRSVLDPKNPLRLFMKFNLSNYGSDHAEHIKRLAINNRTLEDPTGMLHPSVIAALNASVVAPATTLQRRPTDKISKMQVERERLLAQAAQVERERELAQAAQVERERELAQAALEALHVKASDNFKSRRDSRKIRVNLKNKYTLRVNPLNGGRTKKNKKISRKRTFTSKIRKNKKHRKQKTKRR